MDIFSAQAAAFLAIVLFLDNPFMDFAGHLVSL